MRFIFVSISLLFYQCGIFIVSDVFFVIHAHMCANDKYLINCSYECNVNKILNMYEMLELFLCTYNLHDKHTLVPVNWRWFCSISL